MSIIEKKNRNFDRVLISSSEERKFFAQIRLFNSKHHISRHVYDE